MKKIFFLFQFVLFSSFSFAQIDSLNMDMNFKTRAEGNNGYSTLIPKEKEMKTDIASRARVGLNFFFNKLEMRVAVQDARTWGNTASSSQSESISFYESWAKYNFTTNIYIKAGRQALSYDSGRMIWESDWGMQGRTFDAFKVGFGFGNGSVLDAVLTYNSQSTKRDDSLEHEKYEIIEGGERTVSMQLLHFKSASNRNFTYTLSLMNNVVQKDNGGHNSLTTAGLTFKNKFTSKFNIAIFAYYQFGKNTLDQDKNAYDLELRLNYLPFSIWKFTLGGELTSGTKFDENPKNNKSFSPIYTTSHTYNGFMDYFFAGNHFNGPGLIDLNLKNNFNFSNFGNLYLATHYFSTQQEFNPVNNKYLGIEMDMVYGKKFGKSFLLNLGYSQMFASDNMKALKGVVDAKNLQNFVWIGLSFNPQFKLL